MKKINCYDKSGNSVNHLIQWDKNQIIYIDDLKNGVIPEAHFAVSTNPDEARIYLDAVSEETLNGTKMIKIILPNEILLESATLFIFLYYIEETADSAPETTEYFVELPIKSKPCPSDQIYEDNLIFLSLSAISEDLEEFNSMKTYIEEQLDKIDNKTQVLMGDSDSLKSLEVLKILNVSVDEYQEMLLNDAIADNMICLTPEEEPDLSEYSQIGHAHDDLYYRKEILDGKFEQCVTSTRKINGKPLENDIDLNIDDIGLGNVDNTSDLDKPISTATQEAISNVISSVKTVDNKVDDVDKKVDNILLDNAEALKDALRDIFYPIGTIYESVNPTNPSEFIGGTWESWGAGRVSVGVDEDDEDFNSAEMTGGEKDHILTTEEMPSHTHSVGYSVDDYVKTIFSEDVVFTVDNSVYEINRQSDPPTNVGNGEAHNNLQPYITSYKWKRIA